MTETDEKTFTITRIFDAPRAAIWRAWTDPDGGTYPTGGVYHEVVEPERLVFTWADPGDPQDDAPVVTVLLEVLGERTRMVFRVDGVGGQPGDQSVYDGWDSAFDVLTRHLA